MVPVLPKSLDQMHANSHVNTASVVHLLSGNGPIVLNGRWTEGVIFWLSTKYSTYMVNNRTACRLTKTDFLKR
jgi:hypothetical protein